MTDWREVTLGEVIELQRGFDLTEKTSPPCPYPVVSSGGIRYSTAIAKVAGPGVVTGRKGVLGKVYYSQGSYWPHDTTLWVKNFKGNEPKFIYYLLQTLPLASLDAGASNPTLNRNHAHLMPVRLPDHELQRRISNVLGAIDDLIENNQRRADVLDQIAQAVYREWFINLQYPGSSEAAAPCSVSPWSVTSLGDVAELDRTSIHPNRSSDHLFEHFSIPAFDDGQVPRYEPGSSIKSGKFLVRSPAALVSKLNPRIPRVWYAEPSTPDHSVASTEFLVLRPKRHYSIDYLILLARSDQFKDRLRSLCSGTSTSHQRTNPDDFLRIRVLSPPPQLVARVTDAVGPVLRLARVLRVQVRHLTELRNRLLPKLLAGQVDVSRLDLDALMEGVV